MLCNDPMYSIVTAYLMYLQPCDDRTDILAFFVCDASLCFCHFLIWCLGSGVVFDCIDS